MKYDLNSVIFYLCDKYQTISSYVQFDIHSLTVFVLAGIIGYYVVWKVTPALHAPLMSVTNAISSVIIVGAIIATSQHVFQYSKWLGYCAIVLVSINIFGGFAVTHRMLSMFKKGK